MKGFEKNEWKQVKIKQLTTLEVVHYNGRLVKGFEMNEGKQVKLKQLMTLEEAQKKRIITVMTLKQARFLRFSKMWIAGLIRKSWLSCYSSNV